MIVVIIHNTCCRKDVGSPAGVLIYVLFEVGFIVWKFVPLTSANVFFRLP